MTKLMSLARKLHTEEDGAAFIEYTVLLGIIIAVTITTVTAIGTWANSRWTYLENNLPANP
jgi:pilus assembly protein Flp/PilA